MTRTLAPITDPAEVALVRRFLADGKARELRIRHGLSLGEVARSIGTLPGTVWKWEHGRVPRLGDDAALRYGALLAELMDLDEVK